MKFELAATSNSDVAQRRGYNLALKQDVQSKKPFLFRIGPLKSPKDAKEEGEILFFK